jgi:hypothetical protein
VAALLIVKWRFGVKRSGGTIDAGFGPCQLEQLHQAGQLTDAEYQRLRKAAVAKAMGSAADPPGVSKPGGDPGRPADPPGDGDAERSGG